MDTLLHMLPEEIWIRVLCNLDVANILNCKKVCRKLSRIIAESVILQYTLELGKAGMIDGHRYDLTYADRLAMLRAFLQESNSATPSLFTVPGLGSDTIPELGYPSFDANNRMGRILQFQDAVLFRKDGQLWIVRPASPQRAVAERIWRISPNNDIYHPSFRCCVAPFQDLVVMTEINRDDISSNWSGRCFLYSITTGQPHPLATRPTLHIYGVGTSHGYDDTIEIHEDLVAWTIHTQGIIETYLRVWNWKSGEAVWDHHVNRHAAFYLLDEHNILHTSGSDITIHTIDLDRPSSCMLQWPSLIQGGRHCYMRIGSQHNVSAVPPPSVAVSSGSPAFVPDPALRIIAIYCPLDEGFRTETTYDHFLFLIPVSSILSVTASLRSGGCPGLNAPVIVPWDDWGFNCVRCVRLANIPRHLSVHGSRAVLSFLQDEDRYPDVYDLPTFDVRPDVSPGGRRENRDVEDTPTPQFILPLELSRVLLSPAQVSGASPYRVTHREARIKEAMGQRARRGSLPDILVVMEDGVVFILFFEVDQAQGSWGRRSILLRF